ncbi:MAG: hypothetical protein NDI93_06900 [Pseudomonas sp.]|nr:hypothetical protein [Pseudomonas sp.]
MAKVQRMGIREYARHRGCAPSAVAKAIKEERITSNLDEKGRPWIDPEVADIQWAKNTRARADSVRAVTPAAGSQGDGGADPEKTPSGPDSGDQGGAKAAYSDFRAQTEAETLRRIRRENAQAEGLLVERKKVDRAVFDAFRALRDRAMAVGQRAAPRCIGLADAREIERVIDEEQRRAFADWEADMQRRLPHPDGYPAEEIPS